MTRKKTSSSRAAKSGRKRAPKAVSSPGPEHLFPKREVWGLILTAVGAVTIIALTSQDQGKLTNAWSLALRQVFGIGAYPLAFLLLAGGITLLVWQAVQRRFASGWPYGRTARRVVGCELFFFAGLGLFHLTADASPFELAKAGERGGYVGWALWRLMVPLLGKTLSIMLLAAGMLGGLFLAAGIPWRTISWHTKWVWAGIGTRIRSSVAQRADKSPGRLRSVPMRAQAETEGGEPRRVPSDTAVYTSPRRMRVRTMSASSKRGEAASRVRTPASGSVARASVRRGVTTKAARASAELPPLDMLVPDRADQGDETDARHRAQVIEETLEAFGIPAKVVEWHRGPVVTQFGVEPGYVERPDREGNLRRHKIRVSKILSLTNDLALALAAAPIRIEAPVPGRAVVGIEVPNVVKSLVGLRGVLESADFRKRQSRMARPAGGAAQLGVALGRGVSGEPVIADLGRMPHLLLAGATGSGKSVCLNAIIASLLFHNTPDQLSLLLVDPKRVELTKYNGLPHLIAPVMVDVEHVIAALRWLTREMRQRYQLLAKVKARDINAYNRMAKAKGSDILPVIAVIIDELADLMLAAPDDVERSVCRLAQMARATGIHLVIATQRPSVDVVTGLIKANFPARISFAVTSQVDSRVVLDSPGAEKLLGSGDMLFMAPDSPKLRRIQGCFVSDKEVDALVAFWRARASESHKTPIQTVPWEGMSLDEGDADDALLQQAIDLVRQHKTASASFLQRHLRIGYPRAGRLIDQLEELGIVGPPQGGGRSRTVLSGDGPGMPDSGSSVGEATNR